jgi:hypothetical protein
MALSNEVSPRDGFAAPVLVTDQVNAFLRAVYRADPVRLLELGNKGRILSQR